MIQRVTLVTLVLLGAALAAQAANSHREDEEAERLLESIQQSLRDAMPGAIITSTLTAADLRNLDPPNIYSDPDWRAARDKARKRVARAADEDDDVADDVEAEAEEQRRVARAAEPDDDAEEVPASEAGAGAGEGEPGCEDGAGQPPATGLRRWVIRIRNFMFGRRDLEGSEGGEAEGEPESGRTWVESLAHWFAHGIKRMLVRMSGGEQPVPAEAEAGGEHGAEAPTSAAAAGTALPPAPAPAPGRAEPTTTPSAPASAPEAQTSPPEVKAPSKASGKVPTKAKGTAPNKIPTDVPTKAPTRASTPASSDTVYDDEAYSKPRPAFDETNELS